MKSCIKEKYIPTELEKGAGIIHVHGEFLVFKYCYVRLKNSELSDDEIRVMVECFLLHARCLYDFLSKRESEKDNIIAIHFIGEKIQINRKMVLINKINKQLSHITYARSQPIDFYNKNNNFKKRDIIIDQIYTSILHGLEAYNNKAKKYNFDIKSL